jgi:hypothetical protein
MGSALAHRSIALGHKTEVLCRSLRSRSNLPLPAGAKLKSIYEATVDGFDIVLIAAPAWANDKKERLISSFLSKLDPEIPVCSAVAYPKAPIGSWGRKHPFLRFICSPAIANPHRKPLVIVSTTSHEARQAFSGWIGGAILHEVSGRELARGTTLFMTTIVHCGVLQRMASSLRPVADAKERQFAAATLVEAFGLLETYEFNPEKALAACATPRGLTHEILHRFLGRRAK